MELPYIDRHAVRVAAAPEEVWDGMIRHLQARRQFLREGVGRLLARAWGSSAATRPDAEPPPSVLDVGLPVRHADPPRSLVLAGDHRFAAFTMTFELSSLDDGCTELALDTHAAFPRVIGQCYRGLVIGTGAHAVMVRRMLGQIGRRAEGGTPEGA